MGFFSGPQLDRTVQHTLTPDEVIQRLQTQLQGRLNQTFPGVKLNNLSQQWSGSNGTFSYSVNDNNVTGTMSVSSSQLHITVQLPFGAGMVIDTDDAGDSVARELTALLS